MEGGRDSTFAPGGEVCISGRLIEQDAAGSWSVRLMDGSVVTVGETALQRVDAAAAVRQRVDSGETQASTKSPFSLFRKTAAAVQSAASQDAVKVAPVKQAAAERGAQLRHHAEPVKEAVAEQAAHLRQFLGSGSTAETAVPPVRERRRLSVGTIAEAFVSHAENFFDADHARIMQLDRQSITEMLGSSSSASIGSDPDDAMTSFKSKSTSGSGLNLNFEEEGLGYTCRKSLKPESPNQDAWFVVRVLGDFSMYGVLDGHGKAGHHVADFVRTNLPKLFIQDERFRQDHVDVAAVCVDAFEAMQRLILAASRRGTLGAEMSGTTATIIIHDHRRHQLTVAHVGNCTACLVKRSPAKARVLTRDHKPDLEDERARIERSGGRVVFDGYANHRVYRGDARYPGLKISRSLGGVVSREAGIIATPEVSVHSLGADDHALLLCSDGVWEFVAAEEACEMVTAFPAEQAMRAAENLAKESWDRWIREEGGAVVDDITVLLVHFGEHPRIVTCEVEASVDTKGGFSVSCTALGGEVLAVIQAPPQAGVAWLRAAIAERLEEAPTGLRLVLADGARMLADDEPLAPLMRVSDETRPLLDTPAVQPPAVDCGTQPPAAGDAAAPDTAAAAADDATPAAPDTTASTADDASPAAADATPPGDSRDNRGCGC